MTICSVARQRVHISNNDLGIYTGFNTVARGAKASIALVPFGSGMAPLVRNVPLWRNPLHNTTPHVVSDDIRPWCTGFNHDASSMMVATPVLTQPHPGTVYTLLGHGCLWLQHLKQNKVIDLSSSRVARPIGYREKRRLGSITRTFHHV